MDKDQRAEAKDLVNDPWMVKMVKEKEVGEQVQLDVAKNLKEFRVNLIYLLFRIPPYSRAECCHL